MKVITEACCANWIRYLFPPCLLFDNLHIHDIELLPIMSLSSITPHINTLFEIQIGLDL